MSTNRVTALSIGRYSVPAWEGTALCQVDARYVPMMLAAIESRKVSFALPPGDERATTYDGWCAQQVELLMSIGERIINEVRAGRDGVDTPLEARDPAADPYTLNLTSLRTIAVGQDVVVQSINTLNEDNQRKFDEVITAIGDSGASQEDIGQALDMIIFLLGAL